MLHLTALTLVATLRLLALCRLACGRPTAAVALAAQQAGRLDLIRSPECVLAHLWEGPMA